MCTDGDSSSADDPIVSYRRLNLELTCSPSPRSRLPRPPSAQPQHLSSKSHPSFAIPAHNQYNTTISRQDEQPTVNPSPYPLTHPTSIGRNVSSFDNRSLSINYVSLNQSSRLRTSQVFHSTSDLAAHYGIPQFLPPVPCTTPRSSSTPEKQTDTTLEDDFSTLCSAYINMLSQNPTDDIGVDDSNVVAPVTTPQDMEAVNALMEVLAGDLGLSRHNRERLGLTQHLANCTASPEFRDTPNFGEYMTSPFDSPYDEFLTTPHTTDTADVNANVFNPDLPLFSDCFLDDMSAEANELAASPIKDDVDFGDELYTMSPQQPVTPSLDPQSLYASPEITTLPLSPSLPSRRKSNVTGTRKNLTPESLVPLDAPTQPRHYTTPSLTSRKELPATFARKRARLQPPEEEDELASDVYILPPNPTEAQLIEAKRRQNTIAARRSRKRKLEYQRELESSNEQLEVEKEHWKRRALTYEELIKRHGLEIPPFDS
jgi:hypothetical protein